MAKHKGNKDLQGSNQPPLGGQPGYGGITEGNVGQDIGGQPIPGGPQENEPGYPGGSSGKSESGDQPGLLDDRDEGKTFGSMGGRGDKPGRSDIGTSMPGAESVPKNIPSVNANPQNANPQNANPQNANPSNEQPLRQGESSGSREGGMAGSGPIPSAQPLSQGESSGSREGGRTGQGEGGAKRSR